MNLGTTTCFHTRTRASGFGVVELALILLVLGTLVFYLLQQKPPTRVSEVAFAHDFVLTWVKLADGYTEQTGNVLGDGRDNGGWRPASDERMDGIYFPAADRVIQEEIVAALNRAKLNPCAEVRTAKRGKAFSICGGQDIFQALPGGRGAMGPLSGVGLAHVFMPEEDRFANIMYFDHVPLETALSAAAMLDKAAGTKRSLLFPQTQLARWHAQGRQAPEAFTAQPREAGDFAPADFVRLGVIMK